MRNIKKIIALLCIALLAMSATCFAFTDNQAINFLLKANKTTVSAGETVDVTLYAESLTGNTEVEYGTYYIYFDSSKFECAGSITDSSITGYNAKVGTIIESSTTLNYENIATYTFTAKSDLEAGTCKFYAYELAFMDNDGNMNDVSDDSLVSAELVITVTAGGSTGSTDIVVDDEEFTGANDTLQTKPDETPAKDTVVKVNGKNFVTMGENGLIKTYFKKNSTGRTLEANTYGIQVTINGKTYKFPGIVKVENEKAWAIKLVIPEGKFADGTITSIGEATTYGDN